MNIQGIGGSASSYAASKADEEKALENVKKAKQTKEAEKKTDTKKQDEFVKGDTATAGTYNKSGKLNSKQVDALMKAEQQRQDSFVQMLKSMVVKQGQKSNLKLFGMDLFVTKEQSDAAAASIADGGEYSVDAVAGRIMDMAKALSGGDSSKIGLLREAVQKGFKAAGVELGGKLPDISNRTYDEVMKRFDDWEKESNGQSAANIGATNTKD